MKKQIIIYSWLVALLPCYNTFAQEETFRELPPIVVSATSSNISVSAKLNKSFNLFFKDATNLRWYEINKKFLVKFIQNDQENRALFTKNGQMIYHICYGTEKFLPFDVR